MKPKPLGVNLFIVPVMIVLFKLLNTNRYYLRNRLYVTLLAPTLSNKYSIKRPSLSRELEAPLFKGYLRMFIS